MRRKHSWVWIVGLALLTTSLLICFLLGNKKSVETVRTSPILEPAPTAEVRVDAVPVATADTPAEDRTEPAAPDPTMDAENQADAAVVSDRNTGFELPELEISAAPSDSGKPDNEGSDARETVSTPDSSISPRTEPAESDPSQQNPETEPEPGSGSIVIDHNGDIMLPEVP